MSENLENKSKKKRNAYVTALQKEKLIDFITSNYEVLYGNESCLDGEQTKDELWNQLATDLNDIGAVKDVAGWKRCYASLKCSTIRKVKNSADEVPKGLNSSQLKIIGASQSNPRMVLGTRNAITSGQQKAVVPSDAIPAGTYVAPLQRKQLVDSLYGKLELETLIADPEFQQTDNQEGHELEDSNGDSKNDTSGVTVRNLSQYEALQRALLDSATPAIDGQIIDFNDLNDEEQMALLMNGQFERIAKLSESDLNAAAAAAAVQIEDMEVDTELGEPTATEQVDDGQAKGSLEDEEKNLNGPNIGISEAQKSPTEQIETNIQVPIVPIIAPQPGVNISSAVPTQAQPQRTRPDADSNAKKKKHEPRRNHLSTPLDVMAQRILDEQVKTNYLLADILSELRGQRNKLK